MDNSGSGRTTGAAGLGLGLLAACAGLARSGAVSTREQRLFTFVNRDIGVASGPLWAVMQFGNGLTAVAAPVALLLGGRRPQEATRVAVAAAGGWQLAKAVKVLVPRARPAALIDDVRLRDGDPTGGGFVSGHATVAMATAVATGRFVAPRTRRLLVGAACVVGVARVHVGAHLPLDVVGGAGLGLLWGSLCASLPVAGRDPGRADR